MLMVCALQDGLLLDSERLYTQVTNEILAPYNKQLTWEIKAMLMGRPSEESARMLIERTGIPLSPEELLAMFASRQRTLFPSVQPMPGALKLVQHLRKSNIPIAVSQSLSPTSSPQRKKKSIRPQTTHIYTYLYT